MSFIYRLLVVGLLSVGITAATTAQAGVQLFEASWTVKAFGNEITSGTGESGYYHAWGIPLGAQCNAYAPRCPFESTPTSGMGQGKFAPLGGSLTGASPFCAPWSDWQGSGTSVRPARGATPTVMGRPVPPLYRNPQFFTPSGQPNTTSCTGTSTDGSGGKGVIQAGQPVTGTWQAYTTGTQLGGFNFGKAPASGSAGLRATGVVGVFNASYPYVYSYTYATLRNERGVFGPGYGPGSFTITYTAAATPVASIMVKQGSAKFGGTMQMLGALTTKACYYLHGGCSLGSNNWKYDAIGAPASNLMRTAYPSGKIIAGEITRYTAIYYHTAMKAQSTNTVVGSRFPWTTGSVTVTAKGRGPHKTVHYAHGYDNRNTATPSGKGTIQLVSPVMTRWLGAEEYETAGVGILRIKFIPEPQTWTMLLAGASLLGVGHRLRRR
jgi:hypothetical protein